MVENTRPESDRLGDMLSEIAKEFESLESFIEADTKKSERFKSYLKRFYDYLKIQDDEITTTSNTSTKKSNNSQNMSLPELIIDKNLVDTEQIYQQLQLYNNSDDSSSSTLNTLTKFFSKCLVSVDSLSFNLNFTQSKANSDTYSTDNFDTNAEGDQAEDEHDDEDDDYSDDDAKSEDSVDKLLKSSKVKQLKKEDKKSNYGIPDGSDSEISDFEVDENGVDDDDDDEEEEEEDGEEDEAEKELKEMLGEDDDEEDDDDDDDDEDEDGEKPAKGKKKSKKNLEDIDSDEVDDDLADLYDDLGDEKEIMGIGKPSKGFDQIDFDKEDFGLVDDFGVEEYEEDDKKGKKDKKNKRREEQTLDLFDEKFMADEEEDKKAAEDAKKSSFELRQEKLKENIEKIHESMLNGIQDKPWQLKGEVNAKTRPEDSLLQEYLEFDHVTRQAPVFNETTSEALEKLIKQRIKDKAFDDVERKVKPVDMQYEYKKQVVLDQEKSKQGLGDIYEQDYLKQQEANGTTEDKKDVANPKHDEIRKRLQSLFIKLDALSNFHYTPKAPVPELKVVSNMPTIAMEEVAPVNVADTNILAPEEIKAKVNSLPKSKSEEDKTDKKRNLRVKKLKNKAIKVKKEERLKLAQALNPDNVKLNKEIAMNKLKKQSKNMSKNIKILKEDKSIDKKAYRSSTAFFKQLDEKIQTQDKVKNKKSPNSSKDEKKNAKKLKL